MVLGVTSPFLIQSVITHRQSGIAGGMVMSGVRRWVGGWVDGLVKVVERMVGCVSHLCGCEWVVGW